MAQVKIYGLRSHLAAKRSRVSDAIHVEITLFETPRHHWGIRGKLGDALSLSYPVGV